MAKKPNQTPQPERHSAAQPGGNIPLYVSHKRVQAFKIAHIKTGDAGGVLSDESRAISVAVTLDYLKKHDPKIGGYWVRYESEGYESFSPAKAFEQGYERV